jgi:Ca2+-binding RTX toxin-like protein
MPTTFNWIFLGNSATVLDPTEGNVVAENVALLNGSTFGSAGDPLLARVTSATMNDLNASGSMNADNTASNETFTTDIGAGTQTFTFDTSVQYNATITYVNGSIATITAVIVQDTAGNLYFAPEITSNGDTTAQEALPIRSLTLNSVAQNGNDLTADRVLTAFRDGVVSGTGGNDVINASYIEPVTNGNDRIDNGDAILPGDTGNDDSIRGGAGNDSVLAGAGNDDADGGTGADVIDGGAGTDSLIGGSDASSDTLFGGAGNDTLSGGDGADTLWGGADNDSIDGGTGADTIYGGGGNDIANGGDGADLITETIPTEAAGTVTNGDFPTALTGWTVNNPTGGAAPNVVAGTVRFNTANEATFGDSIQQTITTTAGSTYTVSLAASEIGTGSQSHNVRIDVLDSNNNVIATLTQTIANGGSATLSLSYTAISASTTIRITNPTSTPAGTNSSDLAIDNVTNVLTAAATGGNDSFTGGAGNDTLIGGAGVDTLIGGLDNDSLVGGADGDSLVGDDGSDTILGDEGSDTIDGGLGNDSILGGLQTDYIQGGDGDDTIDGGDNTDTVFGGAGNDLITDTGGTTSDDTIFGEDGNDTISGGLREDAISGDAGNDSLIGDEGNDTLTGGADNDTILGGVDNDSIDGGTGNDSLAGEAGNDTLTGGAGDDRFVWNAASNDDVITDFNSGNSGSANDGNQANNDFVDLSPIFSNATLAAYNAINGTSFVLPIQALNHDLATNGGVINFNGTNMSGPTLTLTGILGGLTFDQTNVVCFTAGTLIETAAGPQAVESLMPGDLVVTRDHGLQELRWIGRRRISLAEQVVNPGLRPVRIAAGALGDNLPQADLMVSPQHRVLFTGADAEMLFGEAEVLVVARHLVDDVAVTQAYLPEVTYVHILFDRHEIVQTAGLWSESFQPAERALGAMDADQRAEIAALFPEISGQAFDAARPTLKAHEARVLVAG